jgi:drug/metabolite transporter (DMT)-like permease
MKYRIWIALLTIYLIWGSTYLAIRFAVQTIPPFLMAGTRMLLAGVILFGWMMRSGASKPTLSQWKATGIVGLFLLLGGNGLVSWAEQHVISSVTAVLVGSIPLWIVLVDAVRPHGIRPHWQTITGVLIGSIGIVILINPFNIDQTSNSMNLFGIIALLAASVFWSIGSIYGREKRYLMPKQPLLASGMEMLIGGFALFILGTATGEWGQFNFKMISTESLLGLVYLTIFGSLIAFAAYSWLLGVAPTPLVSTYAYVNPLIAVFLGAVLGKETIDLRMILATVLIIGSVFLINMTRWINYPRRAKVMN